MIALQDDDERKAVTTDDLRLCFARGGDRWRHLLTIGQGGRRAFTESEGHEGVVGLRLPSPVYQEVRLESSPGGAAFLLVGSYGPVHFSASFSVSEWADDDRQGTTVRVDVAARSRQPVESLASTYRVYKRRCTLVSADPWHGHWRGEEGEPDVELLAGSAAGGASDPGATRLSISDYQDTEGDRADWRVVVAPTADLNHATRRWAYYWEYSSARLPGRPRPLPARPDPLSA